MNNISFKSLTKRIVIAMFVVGCLSPLQNAFAETSVWDGTMVRPTQGTGSQEDPFLINTAEEMAYLIRSYDYNEGICYRKYYKLTCDLDMRSTQWTFGSATSDRKSFRACFNGAGHKISNIEVTLKDSQGECHYGLFPQLGGDDEFVSVIENLELENIHFVRSIGDATGTYNFRIGGLVGKVYRNSRISNCIVRGFAVNDYGTDVDLHTNSRIAAAPLYGEILNNFGATDNFYESSGITIDHCYAHGTADLSHFHGREDQLFTTEIQGNKQREGSVHNELVWHVINDDECSFSMTAVEVSPVIGGDRFQYEGVFNHAKGHTYSYIWSLDGKRLGNSKSATITVEPKPYVQRLNLTINDNGVYAGSGAILIEPDKFFLSVKCDGKKKKKYQGTLTAQITAESGVAIADDDFLYSWQDLSDSSRVVSTSRSFSETLDGHTYLLVATHRQNSSAKLSNVKSFASPIFVCNKGISNLESSVFTNDDRTYKIGDDTNDGRTPETAVRTLKRAYQLLKPISEGGSIDQNVIVIMGEYGNYDFTEYMDSRCTTLNPDYFTKDRPALITGQYDNIRNSRMLFAGLSIKFDADIRFEQITLQGSSFEISDLPNQTKVYACGHNLTMGNGITINGYKIMDYTLGLDEGVLAPAITIYGGVLNNNDPNYVADENTITILSGTYGRVIAGDGYTLQMEKTHNVSGTPQNPVRTRIVCDASNYYDPYHTQFDVALIIGGQADGTVFADTRIEVTGNSRVGRIVGGNVGFGRQVKGRPADSFFGRSEVTIKGGAVTEIYGTNLGRFGHILYASETDHDSCVTYFYGKAILNLIGGTIYNTVYGGGAACVTGGMYDSIYHTADPYVPYWKNGKIAFGRHDEALGKMPLVSLRDNDTLDLSKTELHVNIGGTAHIMGSLYGGSVSFSSLLPTHQAGSQSGCIFADTYINMTGGTLDGYIFGGCRGNLAYFDNGDHSNFPLINGVQTNKLFFSRMAQMYGNSHVTVTGGEVKGVIYGGGEGTYYRSTSEENPTNAVSLVGTTFGSTQVNIGGEAIVRDYILGAGNYANILRTGHEENPLLSGNVEININGGHMHGAVFGGGHGNKDNNDALTITARVAGDVRIRLHGGEFYYNPKKPHYLDQNVYGILGGGITTSNIRGNVYFDITHNPFPEELRNSPDVKLDNMILSCGGYGPDCSVAGRTYLTVNAPMDERIERIYMGGIQGTVESTECHIISGSIGALYGIGRFGGVTSNKVNINIGKENATEEEYDSIYIDNIYGGSDLTKSVISIKSGNVMNVLR